jgi:restriction endonuclease Mrr
LFTFTFAVFKTCRMKFNKTLSTVLILALTLLLLFLFLFRNYQMVQSGDVLIPRAWENHILLEGGDYLRHYFYTLTGLYKELPWAVRISYIIIQLSCVAMLLLIYTLLWDVHKRRQDARVYHALKEKYYPRFREVAQAEEVLPENRLLEMMGMDKDTHFSYRENMALIDILLEFHVEVELSPSAITNMQSVMHLMGLVRFMEDRMVKGREKEIENVIEAIRILHIELPDSFVTGLVNHRDVRLRKAARLYYIISNMEDPFLYFEDNRQKVSFVPWDMLETHQIFSVCHSMQKQLPSFIPVMDRLDGHEIKEFFIKETAYWGNSRDMEHLLHFLQHPELSVRKAAIESVATRRMEEAESTLKEMYYMQTEELKREILHTLYVVAPRSSDEFFAQAYRDTSSMLTKRVALRCLLKSGDGGVTLFYALKEKAGPAELILFQHVEDRLIDREVSAGISVVN